MPERTAKSSAAAAVRNGDVETLKQLLREHPSLARDTVDGSRTLLHVATDWPGHIPNGPEIVKMLVAYGADVNARFIGVHSETPLHWAASSDDVDVLEALLDAGADPEAAGGVIGGGTPLSDAVAFGQWKAARRLVEHGVRTKLWEAAALGLLDQVDAFFASNDQPQPDDVTHAFWCACHGGQRETAEYLLGRGADINKIAHDDLTPLDAARRTGAKELARWLEARGARSASEAGN